MALPDDEIKRALDVLMAAGLFERIKGGGAFVNTGILDQLIGDHPTESPDCSESETGTQYLPLEILNSASEPTMAADQAAGSVSDDLQAAVTDAPTPVNPEDSPTETRRAGDWDAQITDPLEAGGRVSDLIRQETAGDDNVATDISSARTKGSRAQKRRKARSRRDVEVAQTERTARRRKGDDPAEGEEPPEVALRAELGETPEIVLPDSVLQALEIALPTEFGEAMEITFLPQIGKPVEISFPDQVDEPMQIALSGAPGRKSAVRSNKGVEHEYKDSADAAATHPEPSFSPEFGEELTAAIPSDVAQHNELAETVESVATPASEAANEGVLDLLTEGSFAFVVEASEGAADPRGANLSTQSSDETGSILSPGVALSDAAPNPEKDAIADVVSHPAVESEASSAPLATTAASETTPTAECAPAAASQAERATYVELGPDLAIIEEAVESPPAADALTEISSTPEPSVTDSGAILSSVETDGPCEMVNSGGTFQAADMEHDAETVQGFETLDVVEAVDARAETPLSSEPVESKIVDATQATQVIQENYLAAPQTSIDPESKLLGDSTCEPEELPSLQASESSEADSGRLEAPSLAAGAAPTVDEALDSAAKAQAAYEEWLAALAKGQSGAINTAASTEQPAPSSSSFSGTEKTSNAEDAAGEQPNYTAQSRAAYEAWLAAQDSTLSQTQGPVVITVDSDEQSRPIQSPDLPEWDNSIDEKASGGEQPDYAAQSRAAYEAWLAAQDSALATAQNSTLVFSVPDESARPALETTSGEPLANILDSVGSDDESEFAAKSRAAYEAWLAAQDSGHSETPLATGSPTNYGQGLDSSESTDSKNSASVTNPTAAEDGQPDFAAQSRAAYEAWLAAQDSALAAGQDATLTISVPEESPNSSLIGGSNEGTAAKAAANKQSDYAAQSQAAYEAWLAAQDSAPAEGPGAAIIIPDFATDVNTTANQVSKSSEDTQKTQAPTPVASTMPSVETPANSPLAEAEPEGDLNQMWNPFAEALASLGQSDSALDRGDAPAPSAASSSASDDDADPESRAIRELDEKLKSIEHSDFYEILGVEKLASTASISRAYASKKASLDPYRDRWTTNTALQKKLDTLFNQYGEAYKTLGDLEKRRKYDQPEQDAVAGGKPESSVGSASAPIQNRITATPAPLPIKPLVNTVLPPSPPAISASLGPSPSGAPTAPSRPNTGPLTLPPNSALSSIRSNGAQSPSFNPTTPRRNTGPLTPPPSYSVAPGARPNGMGSTLNSSSTASRPNTGPLTPPPTVSPRRPPASAPHPANGAAAKGSGGTASPLSLPKIPSADRISPEQIAAIRFQQGVLLFKKKEIYTALHLLREAVRLDPRKPEYHYYLGLALSILSRARKAHNHNAGCHVTCTMDGSLPANQRVRHEAVEHMRKAADLDPNNVRVLADLAALYKEAGMPKKAEYYLDRALLFDTGNQITSPAYTILSANPAEQPQPGAAPSRPLKN